ncbi:hypothetical protein [Kaarinaea lacus]
MHDDKHQAARHYAPWLWGLFLVFVFRVVAQGSLTIWELPFLPPFDAWYSGALSYPQLLFSQIVIMAIMAFIAFRFSQCKVVADRTRGIILLVAGALYFSLMFVRFFIGVFGLSELTWFSRPIPSFFHLVLASFVLLIGHYHFRYSRQGKIS